MGEHEIAGDHGPRYPVRFVGFARVPLELPDSDRVCFASAAMSPAPAPRASNPSMSASSDPKSPARAAGEPGAAGDGAEERVEAVAAPAVGGDAGGGGNPIRDWYAARIIACWIANSSVASSMVIRRFRRRSTK
jgi:hypothetical protein